MPANPALHRATLPDAEGLNERRVDAARYALLRRLAPAMRHDIAGALQPLGMLTAVVEKRLQHPQPDIAALAKNSGAISKLVREAAGVCTEMTNWLAPKEGEALSALKGVHEATRLLGTILMLQGFTLAIEANPGDALLPAGALRQVFSVCLIALTDSALAPAPARVRVTLQESEKEVLILIQIEPTSGEKPGHQVANYRLLQWDDVALLAGAEGVGLERLERGAALRFLRVGA